MVRHNITCPYCRTKAATFFANAGNGMALYRCNDVKRRNPCGRTFHAPHPLPMRRTHDEEVPVTFTPDTRVAMNRLADAIRRAA